MGWLDPSPVLRILAEPTPFCLGPCKLSFAEGSEQEHRASGWVLAGFLAWGRIPDGKHQKTLSYSWSRGSEFRRGPRDTRDAGHKGCALNPSPDSH